MEWRKPSMEPPELPDPGRVASNPCSTGGDDGDSGFPDPTGAPSRPKQHDFVQMEETGYLEMLGYETPEATYETLYREPSKVRQASSK